MVMQLKSDVNNQTRQFKFSTKLEEQVYPDIVLIIQALLDMTLKYTSENILLQRYT